jgi:hypothetical protein
MNGVPAGLPILALAFLAALPAAAKEGYSLLTPEEHRLVKESMKGQASVPPDLAQATDEELWEYIPPASLRRAVFLGPTDVGCPVHGVEIFRVGGGFYPWKRSADRPWKVQCPVGGEYYPSNDFGAYFKAGFAAGAGMKEKLDNTKPYVDDGTGWIDDKGRTFCFVGYWVFWQRWYDVLSAIRAFSNAYFATDDEQYAHKAAVLLCALAEQYPKMDYPKQGVQGGCGGMILPWCWENQSVVIPMSECYDRLFPYLKKDGDPQLREFLKTRTDLGPRKQLEQKFMQTVAKVNFTTDMYWSNECDHQVALATLALAWDNNDPADGITTRQMLDWIMNNGGDDSLEELLFNSTYRDGFPCEGAIGYSASIAERQLHIAELMKRAGVNLFEQFPRLKQVAGVWIDMTLEDGHTPSLGDAGSVLGSGRVWNPESFHRAWENYRDPKFAQALRDMKCPRKNAYSPDRSAEFEQVVKEHGSRLDHRTRNLGGMGLAILESGGPTCPRGLTMYYGSPAGGHSHHDRLNIEFFDHRQAMMPDLGYPDQWGNKATEFTQNTIGHYGVLVDEKGEKDYLAGYLDFLQGGDGLQVVSAHAERCFPGTSLYRRTTALVDVSASAAYVADIFRVRGGQRHDWSFHLPPVPDWGLEGVTLSEPQAKGTLAGEDIALGGAMPEGRPKNGFNWLNNIQRGQPAGAFSFIAKADPPYPSLRMTMLPGCAQEIVVGDHETPRIGQKLPPTMKWLLARNAGKDLRLRAFPAGGEGAKPDLSSVFACVIEACPATPALRSVERLPTSGGGEPVAMRITTSGFRDTIVSDETGEQPVTVGGWGGFQGQWGLVREDERGVSRLSLIRGTSLRAGKAAIETNPSWDGKITAVDLENNRLDVNVQLPPGDALKGEWMVIFNDKHRTCYEIERVEPLPQGSRLQLTEITPMVGKGYVQGGPAVRPVEEDKRLIHTDTRWRVFGKDYIWSGDFGPALGGYALLNENRTQAFEIADCKLMPSRERQWWKPEPAWIKLSGTEPFQAAFADADGDGRTGFWVYDFRAGCSFTIPNSVTLNRLGPGLWSLNHRGGEATVTLPCAQDDRRAQKLAQVLVRAAGGGVQKLACRYGAAAQTVTFKLPANLHGPVALATRSTEGVDLADTAPPVVREVRVNGQPQKDQETLDLFVSEPPKSIELVVEDARNAVDRASVCAEGGAKAVYAGEPGVSVEVSKDSPRRATVRLEPEKLLAFQPCDAPTQYTLKVTVDDVAVDDQRTVREFRLILGPHIPEGSVFLSDLNPTKAFAHAGVKRDTNYLGGEIRLGGALYQKGLMVCPEVTNGPVNYGEAIYEVPKGKVKTFRAVIGIEDQAGGGSVVFAVQLRDGGEEAPWREVLRSGVMAKGAAPQSISVPLGDATALRLYTDANGGIDCDHAVFGAARFEP